MDDLISRMDLFLNDINNMEIEQAASLRTKAKLEADIRNLMLKNKENREALEIAVNAIEILRQVSDETVESNYQFIEEQVNDALSRMFKNTTRRIKLKEYTRSNQYPQLEIELEVIGGKKRSLKADSGHGIAQIVSLLCILVLIVITESRRIMVMDEVMSGLSAHNREIVTEILWTFTGIGFQFIINDHGYVPKGSKVYHLEMVGDVSHVKETYIEPAGIYLNGSLGQTEDDTDTDDSGDE